MNHDFGNQSNNYNQLCEPNVMRKMLILVILAVVLLPLASAETYRISGTVKFANGTPMTLDYVSVACPEDEIQCFQYRGVDVRTDANGYFTVVIDADWDEDDTEIYLSVKGENFTHIIDISAMENSSNNRVIQDIQLEQNPISGGIFAGAGCCILIFGLAFISVLFRTTRRLSTEEGRLEFMGIRRANELQCPTCKETVYQHDLVRHLMTVHDMPPVEAGELTGLVMRKTWQEEE